MWIQISPNLPHSWRCRLPPVTPWATSYNSGTLFPLNSSSPTSTMSLFWRSTGPSADGAASQMLTSRWVHANILIYKICPPPASTRGQEGCFQSWLACLDPLPWTLPMQDSWPLFHGSASFIKLQREGIWVSAADLPPAPQHGWLEHYISILLLLQLL